MGKKRVVNRPSWKNEAMRQQKMLEKARKTIEALEDQFRVSNEVVVRANEDNDILKSTVKQRDEYISWLERRGQSLEKSLSSVRASRVRARDEIRNLRYEVKVRRQIAATLATFHLPGIAVEDACEQFAQRASKIGYATTLQFGRIGGEAYKTASRFVLDLSFNQGVRLDAPKGNEFPGGLSPVDLAQLMIELEIGGSRRGVMDRMREESAELGKKG